MGEIINTFKDLIRLFWDNRDCKIIPLLDDKSYVKGYYLKKNVTAHIADSSFLKENIWDCTSDVLSKANRENEGPFLEELGRTESFPVIKEDGSYYTTDFTSFLSTNIPLMYKDEDNALSADKAEESDEPVINVEIIEDEKPDTPSLPKEEEFPLPAEKPAYLAKDLFEFDHDKIKPFIDEGDFNENFDLVAYIEGIEKRIIGKYLKYYDFNISKTAEALKIPRQTLQYKIKKYELTN